MYKGLLSSISFNVIIWQSVTSPTCVYTNNKYINVSEGTKLKDYLEEYNYLDELYQKLLDTEEKQETIVNKEHVELSFLTPNIFFEIRSHTKKCCEDQILLQINDRLRAPITSIIGFLTLLDQTHLTGKQYEHVKGIKSAVYDIVGVANDIVDVINFKGGKVSLAPENINLEECIKVAVKVIESSFEMDKVGIECVMGPDVPKIVKVDGQRLEQLLVNMLANSVKHTTLGSIILTVNWTDQDLQFKIQDTGKLSDLEKEQLEGLLGMRHDLSFENPSYDFGMVISKYLCQLMGGSIFFKSDEDIGTTYFFSINCQ